MYRITKQKRVRVYARIQTTGPGLAKGHSTGRGCIEYAKLKRGVFNTGDDLLKDSIGVEVRTR